MSELTTAVVTGGATGLGRALAIEAARRGATVLIADVADASESVALIEQAGGKALWQQVDVSDYAAMERLAAFAARELGGVGMLVNNAGIGASGGLDEVDPVAAQRVFDVNVAGAFNGVRAFAEVLKDAAVAQGSAYLLNVGSEHSLGVPPHVPRLSAYTVTKYATLGLTDTARRDFAGTGVSVSLLAPGWVLTEQIVGLMARSAEFDGLVRPFGQAADEVARVALDGLLSGRRLILTNPKSIPFVREHAEDLLAELNRSAADPES